MGLFDQNQGLMGLGQQPLNLSGGRNFMPNALGSAYEPTRQPQQNFDYVFGNSTDGLFSDINNIGRPPYGYDQLGNFIGQQPQGINPYATNRGLQMPKNPNYMGASDAPFNPAMGMPQGEDYIKESWEVPPPQFDVGYTRYDFNDPKNQASYQPPQQDTYGFDSTGNYVGANMPTGGFNPFGNRIDTPMQLNYMGQQPQGQPVNTQSVQPNFMGQAPFGQPQTGQFNSSNPFVQAAQANAQGNLAGALQATSANRVNQQTPFGGLQYQQTGTDAQGNPIWSANQTIAQPYQNAINSLSGQIQQNFAQPFDVSQYQNQMVGQGPQFQGVGQAPNLQTSVQGTGMEGWDKATGLLMSRLNPQIQQQNEASDAQLANQGIMPGSEAYKRAKTQIAQQQNDLLNQAQLAGSQIQNQMFNQNLAAGNFGNTALGQQNTMNLGNTAFNNALGQQGFANQLAGTQASNAARQANFGQGLTQYQLPTSSLGSLRAATTPGYVNPYNQAAVAGPDYLSAYTSQNATDIARANAQAAQKQATLSGLTGLGASAILGGTGPNSALGGLYNLGSKGLDAIGGSGLWSSLFGSGAPAITGDQDFLKSIGLAGSTYGSGIGGMDTDPLAGIFTGSQYPFSGYEDFLGF
jgi:hypothetical protein